MIVNTLPAPTWRWLKVNYSDIKVPACQVAFKPDIRLPGEISTDPGADLSRSGGLGDKFDDWIRGTGVEADSFSTSAGISVKEPVYMDYHTDGFGDGAGTDDGDSSYVNRNVFRLDTGSSFTVIQYITGEQSDTAFSGTGDSEIEHRSLILSNRYDIAKGARLKLIQVINLPENVSLINDNGGVCTDEAGFELIQVVLGEGSAIMGDHCALDGKKSTYSCDIAYYLKGEQNLDMNYIADHNGQRSGSEINVSGVMSDSSSKTFRGTIDFHKGCARAKGSELEEVLLMNEGVVNKTVPLILCDEEDVEGSHGASIGKLDDNLIFYLASRGMDEDMIYKMMARARIDKVASLINDRVTRDKISGFFGEGNEDD